MFNYRNDVIAAVAVLFVHWSLPAAPVSLLPGSENVRIIPQSDFKAAAIRDNVFEGTLIGGQASLISGDLQASAADNQVLAISVKNSYSGDGALAVYWADDTVPDFTEQKKLLVPYTAATQWQTIKIALGLTPGWGGTIRKLRIDVVGPAGTTVALKDIGFGALPTAKEYRIFPADCRLSGYTGFKSFEQGPRQIDFTLLEKHAYTRPIPAMFRAEQYPVLKIRYKTEDTDTVMFVVYFGTLANPNYSEQQVVRTPGEPAEEFQTAEIKLSQSPAWTGVISTFRLDFIADEGAIFKIESITLEQP